MELNKEQIIKVLEHCSNWTAEKGCKGCPYDGNCIDENVTRDALSLIKELTEENERLSQSLANVSQSLANSKADTVRKMLKKVQQAICDNTYPDFNKEGKPINVWKATTGYDVIDQIAKEMFNESKGIDNNCCVVCGEIIPEGRQICPNCKEDI